MNSDTGDTTETTASGSQGVNPADQPESTHGSGPSESDQDAAVPEDATGSDRLVRSSAVLGAGTLASRLTGLLRVIVAAAVMGVTGSRLADVYNLANTAPNQLYELALGGILTSVLVPIFVESLAKKDKRKAWAEIANIFWVALALAATASVILAVFAPVVISITGPNLDAASRSLAEYFLRLFSAQVFFYALNALFGGILYARRSFAVPAFVPVLNNLVVVGVFLAFGAFVAEPTVSLDTGMIWLLGFGTTAGVIVMALANIPAVRRNGVRLPFRFNPRAPVIRKLLRLSLWTLMYVITNQIAFIVVQRLAIRQEGDYTAWTQAFMFFQLPIGLLAVSIMTAMLPGLAEAATKDKMPIYRARLTQAARLTIFLVLPATVGVILLAEPLIELLLEYRSFNREDTILVAGVLQYMAIGLVPFAGFMLVLRSFYALQDTRTPFLVNLVGRGFAMAGMCGIYAALGVNGLALVYSLSFVVAVIIGWAALAHRVRGLHSGKLALYLLRVAAACIPMAALLWAVRTFVGESLSHVGALVEVVIGVLAGAGIFIACAFLLRLGEVHQIKDILLRRRQRDSELEAALPGPQQPLAPDPELEDAPFDTGDTGDKLDE